MAEQRIRARLIWWRLQRSLRTGRATLLGLPLLLLLGAGVGFHHATAEFVTMRSACMTYVLRVPALWHMQPVKQLDCGGPVLVDQYQAVVNGQPVTVTVQAVPITAIRTGGPQELPSSDVTLMRSRSGQAYSSLIRVGGGLAVADANFTNGQVSYFISVESVRGLDPKPVLTSFMDGWYQQAADPVIGN